MTAVLLPLSWYDRQDRAENWKTQGICTPANDDILFPVERRGRQRDIALAKAKALCGKCPVCADCYQWAVEHKQTHGVWGGVDFTHTDPRKPGHPQPRPRKKRTPKK